MTCWFVVNVGRVMPSVYLCNVTGGGGPFATLAEAIAAPSNRPDIPVGTSFSCLMLSLVKRRAVLVSPDDGLSGTGVVRLVSGATWAELHANSRSSGPNAARRTTINTWLTAAGFEALPGNATTWRQVIMFVARQENPTVDLDDTFTR